MNTDSVTEQDLKFPADIQQVPAIVKRVAEVCKTQDIPIYLFDDLPFHKRLDIAAFAADYDLETAFKALKWFHHYNPLSNKLEQVMYELGGERIPRHIGFAYVEQDGEVNRYYE
jgi:hypothetical protein